MNPLILTQEMTALHRYATLDYQKWDVWSLTQTVQLGRLSSSLQGLGSVCSTFPSQMPLAWRPPPVCRSQSCHGRWRQSWDTRWSSCSGQSDLKKICGLMVDVCRLFYSQCDASSQTQRLANLVDAWRKICPTAKHFGVHQWFSHWSGESGTEVNPLLGLSVIIDSKNYSINSSFSRHLILSIPAERWANPMETLDFTAAS